MKHFKMIFCIVFGLLLTQCSTSGQSSKSVRDLMANRYTVRSYQTDKGVSDADLKTILEAGLLAPSKNLVYP